MGDEINLFSHPDGMGAIDYGGCVLIAANDCDATVTRVHIGPAGLRDLAARIMSLADLIEIGCA